MRGEKNTSANEDDTGKAGAIVIKESDAAAKEGREEEEMVKGE